MHRVVIITISKQNLPTEKLKLCMPSIFDTRLNSIQSSIMSSEGISTVAYRKKNSADEKWSGKLRL